MKKFLVFFIALTSPAAFSQNCDSVAESVAECDAAGTQLSRQVVICEPSETVVFYEALSNWYNENRGRGWPRITTEALKEKIELEEYLVAFNDGRDVYEIYRFEFPMGTHKVGVTLTVLAISHPNEVCIARSGSVSRYM